MSGSFLDQERSDSGTSTLHPAGEIPENSHSLRNNHGIASEVKPDALHGNVLLAAGDGNMNMSSATSSNDNEDFISSEAIQSSELRGNGKRKRERSPDVQENEMLGNVEGSDEGSDQDMENMSDDDSKPARNNTNSSIKPSSSEKEARKNIDDDLPDTVTLLKTPEGAKVYLVGTAHFSLESQEDVAKVIRAVQPHVVLVELCKARVNILQLDEKTILEEAKNINFERIHSTIRQNGLFHGLMYILLLSMSAHITKQLGMAPGGEFRRAFAEAKQFPYCIVHLGDRPIHITLQRALSSLSWWQTIRVTWHLIMSKGPISKEEVERCKQRDLLEEMLAEMTGEFPDLSAVFVKERDIYLTHSLQLAAAIQQPSHGGFQPPRVVGVVGMGHVPGILQHWGKVQQEDIHPLLYIPPPTLTSRILRTGVKISLVGLVAWGCYRILPIPKIYPKLSSLRMAVQNVFQ